MNLIEFIKGKLRRTNGSPSQDRKIWLFGPSGIGKKTLIYDLCQVTNPRDCELSKLMELKPRQPAVPLVIDNSTAGRSAVNILDMNRRRLLTIKSIYAKNLGVTWLVHGQSIDLRRSYLPKIATRYGGVLPNSLAIYINISEKEYNYRISRLRLKNLKDFGYMMEKQEQDMPFLKEIFSDIAIYEANIHTNN